MDGLFLMYVLAVVLMTMVGDCLTSDDELTEAKNL